MKFKGFNIAVSWDKQRVLDLHDLVLEEGHLADFDGLTERASQGWREAVDVVITNLAGDVRFAATAGGGIDYAHWRGTIRRWDDDGGEVCLEQGVEDVTVSFDVPLSPEQWDALEALRRVCDAAEDAEGREPCLRVELTEHNQ